MKKPPTGGSDPNAVTIEIRNGSATTNGPSQNSMQIDGTLKIGDKAELLASKDDTKSKDGVDNPAFETDNNEKANGKSLGHPVSVNGNNLNQSDANHKLKDDSDYKTTEEMAEAVNLELMNMSANLSNGGYNGANGLNGVNGGLNGLAGIPVKNPNSTVINMSNPYDEYFIPVNEHRKYMSLFNRGEKLYVTKSKRDLENSKNKCCVWLIGLVTAMIAIGLAVLIATKLNQDNLPSNERRFPGEEGLRSAGIGGLGAVSSTASNIDSHANPSITEPSSLSFLERALEGEFTIDNLTFTPGLADHDSKEFKEIAASVEEELKKALFDHSTLRATDIKIKVINLTPENVIQYRVAWTFKAPSDTTNPPNPTNVLALKERLKEYIRVKNGFLYNYRVPSSKIYSKNMVDDCSINNGNCSDYCSFDYVDMLDFYCHCPDGKQIDQTQYQCEFIPQTEPEPTAEPEPTTQPEPEPAITSLETKADAESPASSEPSTAAEPSPSSEPKSEPEPTSVPVEVSSVSETKAEPEATSSSQPKSEPEATSALAEPTPSSEPKSEPEPTSASSEPTASSEPKSEPEPASASPEPTPSSEPKSEPETTLASAEPSPASEPKSEPESTSASAEPSPASEPKSEPTPASVEPTPSSESKSEPEPTSSSITKESSPSTEPKIERDLTTVLAETMSSVESKAEAEPPTASLEPKSSESSPAPEPKSEPEPTTLPEKPVVDGVESLSEPEPAPETVSTSEQTSKPEPAVSETTLKSLSPALPAAEPKADSGTSSASAEPTPSEEAKEPSPTTEMKTETLLHEISSITTQANNSPSDMKTEETTTRITKSTHDNFENNLINDTSTASSSPVNPELPINDINIDNIPAVPSESTNQAETEDSHPKVESVPNQGGNSEVSSSKPLEQLIFDATLANKSDLSNENGKVNPGNVVNELTELTSAPAVVENATEPSEISLGTVKTDVLSVTNDTREPMPTTEIKQSEKVTDAALNDEATTDAISSAPGVVKLYKEIDAGSIKQDIMPLANLPTTDILPETSSASTNVSDNVTSIAESIKSSQSTEVVPTAPSQVMGGSDDPNLAPVSAKLISDKAANEVSKRDNESLNAVSSQSSKNRAVPAISDSTGTKRRARSRAMLSNLIRAIATDPRLNPSSNSGALY